MASILLADRRCACKANVVLDAVNAFELAESTGNDRLESNESRAQLVITIKLIVSYQCTIFACVRE